VAASNSASREPSTRPIYLDWTGVIQTNLDKLGLDKGELGGALVMPAYLMEQLARHQGEEFTRQAERAQIRSNQRDVTHRRSSRLRLWRLRFKPRKADLPVEIDLRDSGSLRGTSAQDWYSTFQANRANRQAQDLR
jgi:hypothetical protein